MDSSIIHKASGLTFCSTMVMSLLKDYGEFGPLQLKEVAGLSERIPVTATTLITVLKNITYNKNLTRMGLVLSREKKEEERVSLRAVVIVEVLQEEVIDKKNYSLKK